MTFILPKSDGTSPENVWVGPDEVEVPGLDKVVEVPLPEGEDKELPEIVWPEEKDIDILEFQLVKEEDSTLIPDRLDEIDNDPCELLPEVLTEPVEEVREKKDEEDIESTDPREIELNWVEVEDKVREFELDAEEDIEEEEDSEGFDKKESIDELKTLEFEELIKELEYLEEPEVMEELEGFEVSYDEPELDDSE